MGFIRLVKGLLDRLFVVLGAFLGSQVPQFIHQYTQRLAGHVEELNYILNRLHSMASASNKTLDQYIYKFLSNEDPDIANQGIFMQTLVVRWQSLSEALQSIQESSMWTRPYAMLTHLDYPMVRETFSSFQPGISLTVEGIYYTLLGVLFGFLIYHLLIKFMQYGSSLLYSTFQHLKPKRWT